MHLILSAIDATCCAVNIVPICCWGFRKLSNRKYSFPWKDELKTPKTCLSSSCSSNLRRMAHRKLSKYPFYGLKIALSAIMHVNASACTTSNERSGRFQSFDWKFHSEHVVSTKLVENGSRNRTHVPIVRNFSIKTIAIVLSPVINRF